MAEFTLKKQEAKTIRINVGDDSFTVPLQGSLSWKEALTLDSAQGTYAFFKKHIPAEIFDALCIDEYNQIVEAWKTASLDASGKSAGES